MSLNKAVSDIKNQTSGRSGIFKNNVRIKYMSGQAAISFRICPSYEYVDGPDGRKVPKNPLSVLPYRMPDGSFSVWGEQVISAMSVGHGRDFRADTRQDVISPKTFGGDEAYCPVSELYTAAAQYPQWQYLIDDVKDPSGNVTIRASISRPSRSMVMNIVNTGDSQTSGLVQLGIFSKSAVDSLFGDNGLAMARSSVATPDQIAENYISAYAYGDITEAVWGPVLMCAKSQGSRFSRYNITLCFEPNQQPRRWALGEHYLTQRYNLGDISTVVKQASEEQIITQLCKLLNMRSPHGIHEWAFLKEVFGHITEIPEPPAAPAASNTIAAGMGFTMPGQEQGGGYVPPQAPQAPVGGPQFGAPPQYPPAGGPQFGAPPQYPAPPQAPVGGPQFGAPPQYPAPPSGPPQSPVGGPQFGSPPQAPVGGPQFGAPPQYPAPPSGPPQALAGGPQNGGQPGAVQGMVSGPWQAPSTPPTAPSQPSGPVTSSIMGVVGEAATQAPSDTVPQQPAQGGIVPGTTQTREQFLAEMRGGV